MVDQEGRITTHYPHCKDYAPDKNKPTDVIDQTLGRIYSCGNFKYDETKDTNGYYKKGQHCHVCVNYTSRNSITDKKRNYMVVSERKSDNWRWYVCNVDNEGVDNPEFHSDHQPFIFNENNKLLKTKYKPKKTHDGDCRLIHIETDEEETKHHSNGWEEIWIKKAELSQKFSNLDGLIRSKLSIPQNGLGVDLLKKIKEIKKLIE